MTTIIEIDIGGKIYKLRKAVGKVGVRQIAILTTALANAPTPNKMLMDPGSNEDPKLIQQERERLAKANTEIFLNSFEQWASGVLPQLIIETPMPYDEMPGEIQFALFTSMMQVMEVDNKGLESFHVITPGYERGTGAGGSPDGHPTINPGGLDGGK